MSNDPNCPECKGTGERDSGGTHPWGEPAMLPCDCRVPAPAVPDDVAEPWRTMLRQAEDDLRKAHATIEAQAAELARLREVLENEAYEFSERHEVSGFYVARRIRAALTHPTGDTTNGV